MKEAELQNTDPVQLFKMLYRHAKPVKKWILANNGNKADAEDMVQDAMIAFYQMIHKPNFVLHVKPETLLFAIAKKMWLYQLRKNKRLPMHELNEDILTGEEVSVNMDQEEKFKLMERSLVLLGEKCAELLELFYFKKQDMVQIAEKLGFRNDKVAKAMKYKCLEKARILVNTKTNERI